MKILSLRLKNSELIKGEWKIDFTPSRSPATGCLRLPAQPVRENHPAGRHLSGAVSRNSALSNVSQSQNDL